MFTFIKKLRCRKCPFHLGLMKFIVNPCINCKVNGGSDPPPKLPAEYKSKS